MTRLPLLALGVAGILAVALAPHVRQAMKARENRAEQASYERYVEAKRKEIECLERLAATGLPKGIDVQAEIERCRALSFEAEAGVPAGQPE